MNTKKPIQVPMPEEPEIGLYDLFFDKWGFVRKVIKVQDNRRKVQEENPDYDWSDFND